MKAIWVWNRGKNSMGLLCIMTRWGELHWSLRGNWVAAAAKNRITKGMLLKWRKIRLLQQQPVWYKYKVQSLGWKCCHFWDTLFSIKHTWCVQWLVSISQKGLKGYLVFSFFPTKQGVDNVLSQNQTIRSSLWKSKDMYTKYSLLRADSLNLFFHQLE